PDERDAPGDGPGQDGRRRDGRGHRLPAEPAPGGRGERPRRAQRPVPRPGPPADDPVRRAARGGPGDRRPIPRPGGPEQDCLPVRVEGGHGGGGGPGWRVARRDVWRVGLASSPTLIPLPLRTALIWRTRLAWPRVLSWRCRWSA